MANRVFQNVVYQMKDAVDRVVGVIDETGTVISCSELGQIGEVREGVAAVRQTAGDAFVRDGYAYHQFSNAKHNDYAVFVEGTDTTAEQFAAMLSISLQSIKQYHDEKIRQDELHQERRARQHPARRHLRQGAGAALCLRRAARRTADPRDLRQ